MKIHRGIGIVDWQKARKCVHHITTELHVVCHHPMFLLEFSIYVVLVACPVDSAKGSGLLSGVE